MHLIKFWVDARTQKELIPTGDRYPPRAFQAPACHISPAINHVGPRSTFTRHGSTCLLSVANPATKSKGGSSLFSFSFSPSLLLPLPFLYSLVPKMERGLRRVSIDLDKVEGLILLAPLLDPPLLATSTRHHRYYCYINQSILYQLEKMSANPF